MADDQVNIDELVEAEKLKDQRLWETATLCYVSLLPRLKFRARELGYALAVHGSLARDLDLVAIPWVEDASSAADLVKALMLEIGGTFRIGGRFSGGKIVPVDGSIPEKKPHGRMAWTIHLGDFLFIDLSVLPRNG